MRGLNRVSLIGNLGKAPEFKQLDEGLSVARFSLATTEHYRNKEGNLVTQTEWHQLVVWKSLAELAKSYLQQGSLVFVEGKLKTRNYNTDKGDKRYVTEIVVDSLIMLNNKNGNRL